MDAQLGLTIPMGIIKLALFLSKLVNIYSWMIIIRIMLSWLYMRQSTFNLGSVYSVLCKITDPFLNFFRNRNLVLGRLDYSPVIALMVLSIVKSILQILGTSGRMTLGIIIAVIIQNLWAYLFSYLCLILVIILGIRWYCGRKPYDARCQGICYSLNGILKKPIDFVFKLFYKNKTVGEQTLVGVSLLFYLAVYLGAKVLFRELVNFLIRY